MFPGKYSKAAALIKNGDIDGLRQMLQNGLDPEESRLGKSLLDVARKCENWDADSVLWEYKRIFGLPDDVRLALLNIKHGKAEELKAQLMGGLPPDARDNDGRTLLVNALFVREAPIALMLLSHGANVCQHRFRFGQKHRFRFDTYAVLFGPPFVTEEGTSPALRCSRRR